MRQNHNDYAVIVSPNGGIPAVFPKDSNDYWQMMNQLNYEELHSGSRRNCLNYLDEMVGQLLEIQYFS